MTAPDRRVQVLRFSVFALDDVGYGAGLRVKWTTLKLSGMCES